MSGALRPNPFAHATIRHLAGRPAELRVWSVTRSRLALTLNISRSMRADFDELCSIAARAHSSDGAAPKITDYVVLAALGLWAPEAELMDPILLEAPIRSIATASAGSRLDDGFAQRGEVWLQDGPEPPEIVRDAPLGCLSAARPILWHKGSELEPVLPWWPNAGCLTALEAVGKGAPLHPDMLPSLQALADQGILVRRSVQSIEQPSSSDWDAKREFFARQGFVNLGQVLPPGQFAAFRDYWHRLAALDVFPRRGEKRRGSHGEPSSMLLLHLLEPLIEHLVGTPIERAFSYSWVYERGTEMQRHRDRAESRYTVTFLADYSPVQDGPTPWPLFVWPRGQNSPVEIRQSVGDALLFCGEDLNHSRPPFTMGERSTSILLHYVDKGLAGKRF